MASAAWCCAPISVISKLKAHRRKAAERTVHGLWDAIGRNLDLYSPPECANDFTNSEYDAD